MNQDLKFCVNQIILGNGKPFEILNFKGVFEDSNPIKVKNEVIGVSKTEVTVLENRFFCVYFERGEKYPYPDTVFNTESMHEDDNPRPSDHIELSEQEFVVIDQTTQKIYLTSQKHRSQTAEWLRTRLAGKEEVHIKPILAEKDFIDRIKSVNEISLTVVPNTLFNAAGGASLSQALKEDALGYGAEEATLKLKYKKKMMAEIKDQAKEILEHKAEFKDITIVGKDIDGFESTFNTTEITSKISIESPHDPKTKKYVPSEAFRELIEKIK